MSAHYDKVEQDRRLRIEAVIAYARREGKSNNWVRRMVHEITRDTSRQHSAPVADLKLEPPIVHVLLTSLLGRAA